MTMKGKQKFYATVVVRVSVEAKTPEAAATIIRYELETMCQPRSVVFEGELDVHHIMVHHPRKTR